VGGFSINQFNCKWRGNYLAEPGDRVAIVTKDNGVIYSNLLDDKYTYNGGFSATTAWSYGDKNGESVNNPVTIGEKLKQTYAKVDKANKEIELAVSEIDGYTERITKIEMDTDTINTSVSNLDNDISGLSREVSNKMSAEDVSISIQTAMSDGVERVTTTTGFTFNEEGLHINKSNTEITTSITEDGMRVYRNDDEVLTADNLGVKAEDLHATTFLIIGTNSRLENYNGNRTGCFWIGG
jgi:predicted RNA-binding protein